MDKKELLRLIDQAADEEWEELDLRDQVLTELPPEIGKLRHLKRLLLGKKESDSIGNCLEPLPSEIMHLINLTELDLSDNCLTALPSEISHLVNLKSLDLSRNRLTTIPPEIKQCINLTSLYLAGNDLTFVPPEIWELINLMELDLRATWLSFISPEIGQLTKLEQLDLRATMLTTLPSKIWQLTSLTNLFLGRNHLTVIPPEISCLINLIELDLSSNNLTNIPSEISQLTNLTKLDLGNNKLTTIPPGIGQLINLKILSFFDNLLMVIPPEIGQLINLTDLFFGRNQLTTLPSEIGQLVNLTHLELGNNQLTTFPSEIGQLLCLTELRLYQNQLISLPAEIGRLTNLAKLYLSSNQLTTLPPEIGQLSTLTALYLNDNQLTSIPREIRQLTNLLELNSNDNQLASIPVEIGELTELRELGLGNNQLTTLPLQIRRLVQLQILNLHNNPLPLPPEILERMWEPAFILDTYFASVRPLHEAKMLLVGEGGVGKTSLVRRLIRNEPPTMSDPTPGIDIDYWNISVPMLNTDETFSHTEQQIQLNVWDFGGQGVYQATHQFFFTERSLYLVVLNARQGEQEGRLHHWLELVNSLSKGAPVILVVNQIDQHHLQLDERGLKAKYHNIVEVVYTSCMTGEGIEALHQNITRTISQLPHLNNLVPASWFELKNRLETMPNDYISYDQYAAYCQEAGITDDSYRRNLVRVLHDLGVVLNFADERLEETQVLKPEWVTQGIYHILNAPSLADAGGILSLPALETILDSKRYPRGKRPFLIDVMRKFELCHPLPEATERYLVPDLLPNKQPELPPMAADALAFELHYHNFLPPSILPRFMVRMMGHLQRPFCWRNGAMLAWEGCRALVRADAQARRVFILIDGEPAFRRSLLNIIRTQFGEIHATFPRLTVAEHIPLPDHPGYTVDYTVLRNHEKRGRAVYYDGKLDVEFEAKRLLDGIETPQMREERQLQLALVDGFDLEGIHQLCFELRVEYEDLPGEGKTAKSRGLVEALKRHGRLAELEEVMREKRPFVPRHS